VATDLGPYEVKVSVAVNFTWLEESHAIEILATRVKLEKMFEAYAEEVRFHMCRQISDQLKKRGDTLQADDEITAFHKEVLGNG